MSDTGKLEAFMDRLQWVVGPNPAEFARQSGIPYTTLKNSLSGRSKPGVDILPKIAAQGNVTLDWLLTGVGSMRPGLSGSTGLDSDFTFSGANVSPPTGAAEPPSRYEHLDPDLHRGKVKLDAEDLRQHGISVGSGAMQTTQRLAAEGLFNRYGLSPEEFEEAITHMESFLQQVINKRK